MSRFRDFNGSSLVIDFGCGYGDLCSMALDGGAQKVIAVDKDQANVETTLAKCFHFKDKISGFVADLNSSEVVSWLISKLQPSSIAICTSVLPYLSHPTYFLSHLVECRLLFLEVQYADDGPGRRLGIRNDGDMYSYLKSIGFQHVHPIGETTVTYRGVSRMIWACSDQPFWVGEGKIK